MKFQGFIKSLKKRQAEFRNNKLGSKQSNPRRRTLVSP